MQCPMVFINPDGKSNQFQIFRERGNCLDTDRHKAGKSFSRPEIDWFENILALLCHVVLAVLLYDSNFKEDVLLSKFHNLGFL